MAYKPGNNELVLIKCKSYLDSGGVRLVAVSPGTESEKKISLFADDRYRQIVTEEFVKQAEDKGLLSKKSSPSIRYCLVAGKVYSKDRQKLHDYFQEQGWLLYDPKWIKERLSHTSKIGYENSLAVMMAKLLLR